MPNSIWVTGKNKNANFVSAFSDIQSCIVPYICTAQASASGTNQFNKFLFK